MPPLGRRWRGWQSKEPPVAEDQIRARALRQQMGDAATFLRELRGPVDAARLSKLLLEPKPTRMPSAQGRPATGPATPALPRSGGYACRSSGVHDRSAAAMPLSGSFCGLERYRRGQPRFRLVSVYPRGEHSGPSPCPP
jgi:hypothetical protein